MKQLNNETIANLSASVQQAIIDVLVSKTLKAAQKYKVKSILLGGGVAANQKLRDELKLNARRYTLNANFFAPAKKLCTDNGAMIATAAFFNYKPIPWQKITTDPELYFDDVLQ
jgi:N6-L-threonylcarbamoyladenine synthase